MRFHFYALNSLLLCAGVAFAQNDICKPMDPPPPPPPFQSQGFIRLGENNKFPGMIQVIPAIRRDCVKYRIQGQMNDEKIEFNTMMLYDKRNSLTETRVAGSNYLFTEGGYLSTITSDGSLYYKGKVNFSPLQSGGTYFLSNLGSIYAIDSHGFYVDTFHSPNAKIKILGGNYYIDEKGVLTTIKALGLAPGNGVGILTKKEGFVFNDVIALGGSFFLRANGTLTTINSLNGFFTDGIQPESKPWIFGGNYFVGEDRYLYTLNSKGEVFKNTAYKVENYPVVQGNSFMRMLDGSIIVVDGDGLPHKTLMHVSTTGLRYLVTDSLSKDIDFKLFSPKFVP